MFKMDFSPSFLLPCVLVILTIIDGGVCADIEQLNGTIGSKIVFPLDPPNQSDLSVIAINGIKHPKNVSTKDCFEHGSRQLCLRNGFLVLENIAQSDEGLYQFFSEKENKTFFLKVTGSLKMPATDAGEMSGENAARTRPYSPETTQHLSDSSHESLPQDFKPPPTIYIHCLHGGKAELSCEVSDLSRDVYWTLNGSHLNDSNICVKDGGRKIILEKRISGKLVCHRRNSSVSSATELVCDDGDLLKHPLFLLVLAASGGAAVLLAIIVSLITCCCMKSKHNFIPVPAEDEKDEGITLSAICSEGPKNSPNGDHREATDAVAASTTNPGPGSSNPGAEMDPNPKVKPETEPGPGPVGEAAAETEFREVMVDTAALEDVGDCFPDPLDA